MIGNLETVRRGGIDAREIGFGAKTEHAMGHGRYFRSS
jgi:hypothetical protein